MTVLPRAILFDLDDTLIHAYARPADAWLAVAEELAGAIAPLAPAEAATAITLHARTFWADAERHRLWRQRIGAARREIVAGALPTLPIDAADRLADRFSVYREEQMRPFEGAHETLDALKARGVLLALVTNGAAESQRPKVERFDLARRFDHIQIEGEHEFGKPDERAYRHAMSALGVEARDTWMVGDHLEWEIAAPQRLGIFAIWHDALGEGLPADSPVKPDRIIGSLGELLE
ncbi:MAG: HAD family hydrolase [Caulobacteraceae bacterium]